MAHPADAVTLAEFEASIQATKNHLVAIHAKVQAQLGLARQRDNHIVRCSLRRKGGGRWIKHYAKLTHDNEFAAPLDVLRAHPGQTVEVRIHRFSPDTDALAPAGPAAAILQTLAGSIDDPRVDGSTRVDEYLRDEAAG